MGKSDHGPEPANVSRETGISLHPRAGDSSAPHGFRNPSAGELVRVLLRDNPQSYPQQYPPLHPLINPLFSPLLPARPEPPCRSVHHPGNRPAITCCIGRNRWTAGNGHGTACGRPWHNECPPWAASRSFPHKRTVAGRPADPGRPRSGNVPPGPGCSSWGSAPSGSQNCRDRCTVPSHWPPGDGNLPRARQYRLDSERSPAVPLLLKCTPVPATALLVPILREHSAPCGTPEDPGASSNAQAPGTCRYRETLEASQRSRDACVDAVPALGPGRPPEVL